MKRVIGFCGKIGSGKSTAARYLVEEHGFVRKPFAGPLKEMFAHFLSLQGASPEEIQRMVYGDLKEEPTEYLSGQTPRLGMQLLGTEWGRAINCDLWVDAWMRSVAPHPRVVVDDVRFVNEMHVVHEFGGIVIELRGRQGETFTPGHISERIPFEPDRIIENPVGPRSLERLHGSIHSILAEL
jgi:hypothetical protein